MHAYVISNAPRAYIPRINTRINTRSITAANRIAAKADFPRFTAVIEYLHYDGVEPVTTLEAKSLLDSGEWVLVDVRPMTDKPYKIDTAIEIPIFEAVDMSAFRHLPTSKKLKALAHTANGVKPMDLNQNFASQVLQAADGRGVILACEEGGSMQRVAPKQSRSIKAAWKLTTEKPSYPTVILNGGTTAWVAASSQ